MYRSLLTAALLTATTCACALEPSSAVVHDTADSRRSTASAAATPTRDTRHGGPLTAGLTATAAACRPDRLPDVTHLHFRINVSGLTMKLGDLCRLRASAQRNETPIAGITGVGRIALAGGTGGAVEGWASAASERGLTAAAGRTGR